MNRKLHRIKAFTLALLALCGLTAFMVTGAQANWLVKGANMEADKTVVVKKHTAAIELDIPNLNVEIRCTTLAAVAGLKIELLSEKGLGKVAFSNCETYSPISVELKSNPQPECKPSSQPIIAGGIALIKLLAKTKGGTLNNYILLLPESGQPFATVQIPDTCGLIETANVTGSLVAECGTLVENKETKKFEFGSEDCKTERVEHLLRQGPTTWFESDGKGGHVEVKDELRYGADKANLLGLAAVELTSAESWAGHI